MSKTIWARGPKQIISYQMKARVVTNGIRAYTQPEVWPKRTLGPKRGEPKSKNVWAQLYEAFWGEQSHADTRSKANKIIPNGGMGRYK